MPGPNATLLSGDVKSSDMEAARFFANDDAEIINVVTDTNDDDAPVMKIELTEKEKRAVKQRAELRKNLVQVYHP